MTKLLWVVHIPFVELHGRSSVKTPLKLMELPKTVIDLNPITKALSVAAENAASQYVLSKKGVKGLREI